jgi:hypothetical protein
MTDFEDSETEDHSGGGKGSTVAAVLGGMFALAVVIVLILVIVVYTKFDGDWTFGGAIGNKAEETVQCAKTCDHGTLNAASCMCVCDDGYYGDKCDQKRGTTDPPAKVCPTGTCTNGKQNPDNCSCDCNQGFEMKMGTCVPCTNGCVNGKRSLNGCDCYCDVGWYGADCNSRDQTDAVVCTNMDNLCKFGTLRNDCKTCDCWDGFSGATCDKHDCSGIPCDPVHGSFGPNCECQCKTGWMGKACDKPVDAGCTATVCYNGSVDSNCKCVCRPGFGGKTCRLITKASDGSTITNNPADPNWMYDYNKCVKIPGAVWTGFQCMTTAGGCPMGNIPYQCVERGGFKYVHRYQDADPWQCALGDETNWGSIGDATSYEMGSRCMSAQSLQACGQLLDNMGCVSPAGKQQVCFSSSDPSCNGKGLPYMQ